MALKWPPKDRHGRDARNLSGRVEKWNLKESTPQIIFANFELRVSLSECIKRQWTSGYTQGLSRKTSRRLGQRKHQHYPVLFSFKELALL